MQTIEQIAQYRQFLEQHYLTELTKLAIQSIVIDFQQLCYFNPDLSSDLLDYPEESLKIAALAVQEIIDVSEKFYVRVKNLPPCQKIAIRDIRSKDLNKLLFIEAVIRQKSDVRPSVTSARFECPSCGNIIPLLQIEAKFKEPSRCGCGRKGKFKLLSKELIDCQKIICEEEPENFEDFTDSPRRLDVFLKEDLVSPLNDKKTSPGTKVRIVGIIREVPIAAKDGGKLVRFNIMLDAISIEPLSDEFSELNITEEDERKIQELAAGNNLLTYVKDNFAPGIYGNDKLKEACCLQYARGVDRKDSSGKIRSGVIHMVQVGDPGQGKSEISSCYVRAIPKGRKASGSGASAAGLTAAIVDDSFLGGKSLAAGAIVRANKGVLIIDELDKLPEEERKRLHDAMSEQIIIIDKADIHATLTADTCILGSMNPINGCFDESGKNFISQIGLIYSLLDRFDLIFIFVNKADSKQDTLVADRMLKRHAFTEQIDIQFLKKIFKKVSSFKPELSEDATTKLNLWYVENRKMRSKDFLITPRHLNAARKLSEAYAKWRLSNSVDLADVEKATALLNYCIERMVNPTTIDVQEDDLSNREYSKLENPVYHKCNSCGNTPCHYETPLGRVYCSIECIPKKTTEGGG